MASYQDLETRLVTLEKKIEFVLKAFQIITPDNPFAQPHTLLEEYYRVQRLQSPVIVTDPIDVEPVSETN